MTAPRLSIRSRMTTMTCSSSTYRCQNRTALRSPGGSGGSQTCMAMEQDKARGIELRADDYITKSFSHKELIARVDAALRGSPDR